MNGETKMETIDLITEKTLEELKIENERLKDKLRKLEEEIKELKEAKKELEKKSYEDSLTELFNRRYFDEKALPSEIKRAERYKKPLSLIMTDIDYFREINNRYGHPIGDEVLKNFAKILKENIREGIDIPVRYGGEEFVILCPYVPKETAGKIAERLRKKVEETTFLVKTAEGKSLKLNLSASFGVTDFKKEEAPEVFIKRADDALYLAKAKGRNKTWLLG